MDFTLDFLEVLLRTLNDSGFSFTSVKDHASQPEDIKQQRVILRHDVDMRPANSLACARMEASLGITGTYYFRITSKSFDEDIIREIASGGHEIGYHYEDLDLVARKEEGRRRSGNLTEEQLAGRAAGSFMENLAKLRDIAPVSTACMHGSPMSPYDSRLIWKHYDYKEMGINTEPYFDLSLDRILYLTDTGRRWDGSAMSIRDRVYSRNEKYYEQWVRKPVRGSAMAMTAEGEQIQKGHKFRKTRDLITASATGGLPGSILLTLHPQRWSTDLMSWITELVSQNIKNRVKYIINKRHSD